MNRSDWGDEFIAVLGEEALRGFRSGDRRGHDAPLEQQFRAELSRVFAGDDVFGEELGGASSWTGTGWIIDPIDGTNNFEAGLPFFCVSVAYCEDGIPVLGWIIDPVAQQLWKAERGQGVTWNGQPLQIPPWQATRPLVALSSSWRKRFPEQSATLSRLVKDRTLGAMALEMCWVASGRLVGGVWDSARAWDIAAATLIAQEAGAVVASRGSQALRFGAECRLPETRFSLSVWHPDHEDLLGA